MLARTQERDLRAWLYGRAPSVPGVRLRDALDAMAGRIERSHAVKVETVVVGDAAMGRGRARPGGGHQRGHPECRQPLGCRGGIGLRGGGGRCGRRLRARPRRGLRSRHRSARPAWDRRLDRGPHAAPRRIGGGGERRGWDGGGACRGAWRRDRPRLRGRRSRALPLRRPVRAARRLRDRGRRGHGRRGGERHSRHAAGRRSAGRAHARRRRPRGDQRGPRGAAGRPLPGAQRVGRGGGRDRRHPRGSARLRHQVDLGGGAGRRHPPGA